LEVYRAQFPTARIAWLLSADNKRFQGLTLEQFLELHRGSAADVLCDLLIEERLAVLLVLGETDDEIVEPMLQDERYMMGSDGIYHDDGAVHARVFGSAPRVLGQLVRERGAFSLEEGIYKLAAFPAARYGLTDRGTLATGKFADVVVFDPQRVADRTTPENSRAQAVGIEQLFVNGRRVWSDNASLYPVTRETPGRWLRYRA
jgi:N-acyl-D-amino-acid deacylase